MKSSSKKDQGDDREKRLADALRANLKRRKAQAKSRKAPPPTPVAKSDDAQP
ncbi:MAG: hypothetical protein AAGK00_00860 [Pseudomonadota bacterium]